MQSDQINHILIALFDSRFSTEKEAADEVVKLIQGGANPNFMIREPNSFIYPVAAAANRGFHSAIERLIEAGGRVHWPTDEVEIDQAELSGHEDEPYRGYPCDPLVCAMDSLAWWLVEYDLGSGKGADLHQTIRMLIDNGADPHRRDPATCKTPAETMLITLNDNYHATAIEAKDAEIMADILMLTLPQKNKSRCIRNIAARNFSNFDCVSSEFFEAQPFISDAMVSIAEQTLLSSATRKLPSSRRKPQRL